MSFPRYLCRHGSTALPLGGLLNATRLSMRRGKVSQRSQSLLADVGDTGLTHNSSGHNLTIIIAHDCPHGLLLAKCVP